MLACGTPFPLDGQAYMSKQGGSPDYECMRRLRECEARSNRLSRIKVPGAELGQTELVRVCPGFHRRLFCPVWAKFKKISLSLPKMYVFSRGNGCF